MYGHINLMKAGNMSSIVIRNIWEFLYEHHEELKYTKFSFAAFLKGFKHCLTIGTHNFTTLMEANA